VFSSEKAGIFSLYFEAGTQLELKKETAQRLTLRGTNDDNNTENRRLLSL